MARLIRTEKEVEGRFEEVWLVVEEDPLEQWPDGPLDVVGRPASRQDGLQRATGKARYTADVALPGMLHTAVLRSPHARARVKSLDASAAREAPGVRAVLEPGDIDALVSEANYQGQPIAAVAAETFGSGARGARAPRRRVRGAGADARSRGGGPGEAAARRRAHARPR